MSVNRIQWLFSGSEACGWMDALRMLHHLQCSQTPAAASSSEVTASWPYCAPDPRKSAASHLQHKKYIAALDNIFSTPGETRCFPKRFSAELVSIRMREIRYIPARGYTSVPLCRSRARPLLRFCVLTGFLLGHKGPLVVPWDCAAVCMWKNKRKPTWLRIGFVKRKGHRKWSMLRSFRSNTHMFTPLRSGFFLLQRKWSNWGIISATKIPGRWCLKTGLTPSLS